MGYRIHKHNGKYKVVEVNNGEIKDIEFDLSQENAKSLSRNLNFGAGFDGKTPDFFLHKLDFVV